jgi:hypothetical protein
LEDTIAAVTKDINYLASFVLMLMNVFIKTTVAIIKHAQIALEVIVVAVVQDICNRGSCVLILMNASLKTIAATIKHA